MAQLSDHPSDSSDELQVEHQLRARIAELEALVDARTQTIIGLGARLAELQGNAPPALADRVRIAESELEHLRGSKVMRYSALPRRLYGLVGRFLRA